MTRYPAGDIHKKIGTLWSLKDGDGQHQPHVACAKFRSYCSDVATETETLQSREHFFLVLVTLCKL